MITLLPACALLLSSLASAETPSGLPDFRFVGAAQMRTQTPVVAAPAPRAADVIVKGHMLIQAGKDSLYGYADDPAQFAEAAAYWSEVLKAAGIRPGSPSYSPKDGLFVLPYQTADGRAIRGFLADPRQFPPKDENGLRANMALARNALAAAGLTPVSARVVNLDFLLPTYSILYLVKPDAVAEHETRLRVLKPGDGADPDLIKASGVTVVQTPAPWLLVYVGPELGYVVMAAKTREDAVARLEKRKAFLLGEGKRIVGEKIVPLDDAEYKFAAELCFFQ